LKYETFVWVVKEYVSVTKHKNLLAQAAML
jgi:hypothetical protein